MSNEKLRGEFEKAFMKRSKDLGEIARLDRLSDGRYEYVDTSTAWWSWQASREALFIDLSEATKTTALPNRAWLLGDDVVQCIEAAGAKVAP